MNNGWNWNKPRKSGKPCKPSKVSKPRKQRNNRWEALKENLLSNLITDHALSEPSELSRPWKYDKRRKTSKPCKPSKLSKPRTHMDNGRKTLKSDLIWNLRKGLTQVNQVNLVDHENIMKEGSLPCKPSKP